MKNEMLSRRHFMATLGGIGVIAASGTAFGMSRQTVNGDSEIGTAYANRCTSQIDNAHTQLIGDLQAILQQRTGVKGEVLTQTAYCPICGCPVTATRTID